MRFFTVICLSLLLLSGCAGKPLRHLASDAALLSPGQSTRQDVLLYLGQPDLQRSISPGVEEYVYQEEHRSELGRTRFFGALVKSKGYDILVVTLTGDLVTGCEFRTYDRKDQDWTKDFSWEDIK